MSAAPATRRAMAELDFGEGNTAVFRIGNRSIHQFWHLFSVHFRHVLLAPQRRPDSGRVAWAWREAVEKQPVTVTELVEVRRRLTEANRSLTGGFGGLDRDDDSPGVGSGLERQVRAAVGEMVEQLIAQRDFVLAGFVCRTEAGLMLHSWGAAVAATPFYPDTQNGEISGAVFFGAERLAGIKVVLENAQGHGVAQVSSDRDGSFRFPNLVHGDYRVRVADRSDFPANGLVITLERESVIGLELRGAPLGDSPPVAVTPAPAERTSPWYKRRRVALIALLAVVALGLWAWRSIRSSVDDAPLPPGQAGWQSASNQVAAGTAKHSATNDQKVGADGAWSSLSHSLPDPKIPAHRPSAAQSMGKGNELDRAAMPAHEAGAAGSDHAEPKNPAYESSAKASLSPGVPAEGKSNEPGTVVPAALGENAGEADGLDQSGQPNEETKLAADKPAKMLPPETAKKRSPLSGGGSSSVEDASEAAPAAAQFDVAPDSSSSAPAAKGSQSAQATTARKQPASSGAAPASVAGSQSEAPPQSASAAAGSVASANQSKPSAGQKSKEKNNGLSAQASEAAVANSGDLAAVAGAEGAAPASDSSPANSAAKSKRDQRAASALAAPEVEPAAEAKSLPEESADDPAPTSRAKAGKKSGVASPPNEPSALLSETRRSPVAIADGPLVVLGRVRASVWQPRLIQDRILPTTPVTAAEEEALDAMREKLLRERAAQMPAGFRQPQVTNGFVLEVSQSSADNAGEFRWHDSAGAELLGATVRGNRAEFFCPAEQPPRGRDFVLSDPDGREVVRISVDQAGAPLLKGAEGLRAWYWVGVEGAATSAGNKFDWRLLSGGELPTSWTRDDDWREGRGQRVEIPLDAGTAQVGNYQVALVDSASGWALVGAIAVEGR